jgi:hypothetical protein
MKKFSAFGQNLSNPLEALTRNHAHGDVSSCHDRVSLWHARDNDDNFLHARFLRGSDVGYAPGISACTCHDAGMALDRC